MARTFPTISLCMITKNEEDWIGQCIRSVQSVLFETIVVDTGSTDRTVEIAKDLGAKVFSYAWTDDFSDARNYSLSRALGDWILILDADEAIDSRDLPLLRHLTKDPTRCYEFLQRHYTDDHRLSLFRPVSKEYPEWEKHYGGFFESNLVRLFPNHPGLLYRGRVHELVEHSIRELGRHTIVRTDIPIHHYGHTQEVRAKKDKSKLYSPLGKAKLQEQPAHWQAFFEMGVEHNVNKRLLEATEAFQQSLRLYPEYVPAWVNFGYVLCELERWKEAILALQKALELDPNCHEAFCNLGVVYLRTQQYQNAEHVLNKAVQLSPTYINAFCNLGKALVYMGRFAEAVNIYRRVLDMFPNCESARNDLEMLYSTRK